MNSAMVSPVSTRLGPVSLLLRAAVPACVAAAVALFCLGKTDLHHAAISLVMFGVILGVAVYDIRTLIAPNVLIYPGVLFALLSAFTLGQDAGLQALGGALVAFFLMLLVAIAGHGKMGMGDVKMAALCGAAVGLRAVIPMLVLTFVVGGAIAAGVLLSRRRRPGDVMAFTPLLAVATVILTLTVDTYLNH
jgi:prepilin signal peptidase PulO-like enzyme (type II secretory pathway)